MQYLKPNVCKQLEAMGLVSESGKAYYFNRSHQVNMPGVVVDVPEDEPRVYEDIGEVYDFPSKKLCQAFTISDILLNADNARKLWSDREVCINCGGDWAGQNHTKTCGGRKFRESNWDFKVHHLLRMHLSGTDIEPELQKAIESKPL